MKLRQLGSNKTELTLNDGRKVLFSYETPVAYTELTPEGRMFYKTSTFYSVTTSKHINSWLPKDQAVEVDQSILDEMVA